MEKDYSQFSIKVYQHWELFLHEHQSPYIGRCYAWARREDAERTSDMTWEERDELFAHVIPEFEWAVLKLFQHDWLNVASFGNTTPHLHWHLIPRYREVKEVYGIQFIDPNPKGNYAPYPKRELPLQVLLDIKDKIKSKL